MKTGIILTTRLKSSRIKEKVIQKIGDRTLLEIILDNLSKTKYPVIVAIPKNQDDDVLKEISESKGYDVFRGADESPLHRLFDCAQEFGFDYVVRITHDDILIDPYLLEKQIQFHIKGKLDYTYMRRCPEGVAGEVISVNALENVIAEVGDKPVEFVSYHLKQNGFNWKEFYPPYEYQWTFRLTIDYEDDLILMRVLFSFLKEPFTTLDIINFFKSHKYLLYINKLPVVTFYTVNYNYSDYIIDCMESVLSQDIEKEYIIIDDCSTDDSLQKITKYYSGLPYHVQKDIKIMCNDENMGLPASCNMALGMAKGRYIMRVDSDDVLRQGSVTKMIEELKLSETNGCMSDYDMVDENLNKIETVENNKYHAGCALLSTWCANEIKFKEDLEYMEGKEFFERFKEKYDIAYIKEPLWMYRQHERQKTKQVGHPNNQ